VTAKVINDKTAAAAAAANTNKGFHSYKYQPDQLPS